MFINDLNVNLFGCINSFSGKYPILDQMVIFLSHDLNTGFILFLMILGFLKGREYRVIFAKTLLMVLLALLVCNIIEHFYYHPRPFVLHLGHQLVNHVRTTSFPSHHTLTIAVIAFSYLIAGYRKIGILGILCSLLVGWSRIYIGVHYPLDVLGSLGIALILVNITNLILNIIVQRFTKPISIQILE
ncbi:undecaprenyl-diphosphatase [Acinetobacter seifertii]|uniref:undecaprenyl-diphosphatase n=1 Tax=Acinetobacter seifertii TaxID=1530123 RepID=UPI003862C6E2